MNFWFPKEEINDQGDDGNSTDDSSQLAGQDRSQDPDHDDTIPKRNLDDWLKFGGILSGESETDNFENINQKQENKATDSAKSADKVTSAKSSSVPITLTSGPSIQPAEERHLPCRKEAKLNGNLTASEKPQSLDQQKKETDQNETPNQNITRRKSIKEHLGEKKAQRARESLQNSTMAPPEPKPKKFNLNGTPEPQHSAPQVLPLKYELSSVPQFNEFTQRQVSQGVVEVVRIPDQEKSQFDPSAVQERSLSPADETKYLNEYHEAAKRALERRLNKLTIQEFFENDWQGISNSVQTDVDSQFRITLSEFNVQKDEQFKKASNFFGLLWTFLKDQVVNPFEKNCFKKFVCVTNQQFQEISSKFKEKLHDKIVAQFADDHKTLDLIYQIVNRFISEWCEQNKEKVEIVQQNIRDTLIMAAVYYDQEMSVVLGSDYCDPVKLENHSTSIAKETETIYLRELGFKNDEWTKQFESSFRSKLQDRLHEFQRINKDKKLIMDNNLSKLVQVAKETYSEAIKQSFLDLRAKNPTSNLSQFFDQVENSARKEALSIFDKEGKAYEKNLMGYYRSKLIGLINSTRELKRDLVDSEDKLCATRRRQLEDEEMERKRRESEIHREHERRRSMEDILPSTHLSSSEQGYLEKSPITNVRKRNWVEISQWALELVQRWSW